MSVKDQAKIDKRIEVLQAQRELSRNGTERKELAAQEEDARGRMKPSLSWWAFARRRPGDGSAALKG